METDLRKTKLLNYTEYAEILGVSQRTVSRWVKAGKIRTVTLPSGRVLIPEDTLVVTGGKL